MYWKAFIETITLLQLIAPKMLIGMLVASVLFSLPQFEKVTKRTITLASSANLKSGVAIAAFFANKVVAMSILADMYKRGLINSREVMIASVIGMFPLGIRAVTLILAPVAVSALGLKLGLILCSLELMSRFFRGIDRSLFREEMSEWRLHKL